MRIGVPKEIKTQEYRVAATPESVADLAAAGHEVVVERRAGAGSGFADEAYLAAGATLGDAAEAWDAELVVKVKEPQQQEYGFLRDDLVLFTYLHLAANRDLTSALLDAGTVAIAYETVQTPDGRLPLLAPMSEIAGQLAVQHGVYYLQRPRGGRGVLAGAVAGIPPARVVIVGGGVVGYNAAVVALGLGAHVQLLDISIDRLRALEAVLGGRRIELLASTPSRLAACARAADLVVGAVLVPGASAPKVLSEQLVAAMRPGSVLVDVAIDQGGCAETSRPTTYDEPVYEVDGVIHCCVANLPGAVPVSSTLAITNTTAPYVHAIGQRGWRAALADDAVLAAGLNTCAGRLAHAGVADAVGLPWHPVSTILSQSNTPAAA